jgi:uncharacterized membrane protein
VRWPQGLQILRQIDLPRLLRAATDRDVVIEVCVGVGEELRRDMVLFAVRGRDADEDHRDLVRTIEGGPDRTFDQDPLFAFRLLVDIALRALSAAVNDPFTAVQAMGGIHQLLHDLMSRDLHIGYVRDPDNALRVVLKVPYWADYVAAGVDELVPYLRPNPLALHKLQDVVDTLLAEAPPDRRAGLEARRQLIAAVSSTEQERGLS